MTNRNGDHPKKRKRELSSFSLIDIAKDIGNKIAPAGLVIVLGATSVLGTPVQSYDTTAPATVKDKQVVQTEYEKPILDGYDFIWEGPYDVNEDGVKESIIQLYKNSKGDSIFNTSIDGKKWLWGEKSNDYPQNKNITENYGIIDTDCNGTFDAKYNLETELKIPSCMKK